MASIMEISEHCRICLGKEHVNVRIFDENGDIRHVYLKITDCLPLTIHPEDNLPKKICEECSNKLDSLNDFVHIASVTEKQLLMWLEQAGRGPIIDDDVFFVPDREVDTREDVFFVPSREVDTRENPTTNAQANDIPNMNNGPKSQVKFETEDNDVTKTKKNVKRFEKGINLAEIKQASEDVSLKNDAQPSPSGIGNTESESEEENGAAHYTNRKENICSVCNKRCKTEMHLKAHLLEHVAKREYSMNDVFKTNMEEHTHPHSVREVCSKVSVSKKTLTVHLESHGVSKKKEYTCKECKKVFLNETVFNEHDNFHKNIKPFKCNECEKTFMYSRYLAVHTSTIHKKSTPSDVTCEICKKEYKNKKALRAHLKTHSKREVSVCHICGKQLSSRNKLREHIRVHTGVKPYKCSFCEKAFSKYSTRYTHETIHTGVRPYKCDVCEKCFTQSSSFIIHTRLHTGEKPYICHICGKGFISRNLLNLHLRNGKSHE